MRLSIDDRYLWFPVKREAEEKKLHFYIGSEKFQELDIKLSEGTADFFFAMDVEAFVGKDVEIRGDFDEAILEGICCHKDKPSFEYKYRPRFHFTAEAGWINDPNGLIFSEGVYHLYYQWNPYGVDWGNMHWGHAVSRDLITWEHRPVAMAPDEYGTIYSGCAWRDLRGDAGFGKDSLLYFYTASGGRNEWSRDRGRMHEQRLAVSKDSGDTLEKKCCVVPFIKGENRDPFVFYHEKSGAYIMVLYLDGNEFAILRSEDLLHWTESDRFAIDKMWECPGLFELAMNTSRKWVFWSADGYYMIGSFDGYRFMPETEVLSAYQNELPYAAQIYAALEDRTVAVAWYRTKNDKGGFRGMMSIPMELGLFETEEGPRLTFKPVRELWDYLEEATGDQPEKSTPLVLLVTWKNKGSSTVRIGENDILIKHERGPSTIIIDHGIVECFSDNGTFYKAVEVEEDILWKTFYIGEEAAEVRVNHLLSILIRRNI